MKLAIDYSYEINSRGVIPIEADRRMENSLHMIEYVGLLHEFGSLNCFRVGMNQMHGCSEH